MINVLWVGREGPHISDLNGLIRFLGDGVRVIRFVDREPFTNTGSIIEAMRLNRCTELVLRDAPEDFVRAFLGQPKLVHSVILPGSQAAGRGQRLTPYHRVMAA